MLDKVLMFLKSAKFYGPIITIIVSIVLFNVLIKILDKAIIFGKDDFSKKKRTTIVSLFKNILKYVMTIIAAVVILNIYGVDTTSIIAGLGVAGVVVGLALQDALKDIIGGINIIMDNYYVVGDLVTCGDFTGTISEFGLKTTKIINAKGETLIIANRNIDKIVNLSQKKKVLFISVPTAYEEKASKVEKVLQDVLEEVKKLEDISPKDCLYLGVDEFASSAVNYLIQVKCVQGKQFAVRRKVLGMIKEAYDKNDIKIPYEQIEVHNGKNI